MKFESERSNYKTRLSILTSVDLDASFTTTASPDFLILFPTDFANSEPVPGFTEGALQMSFVEIRQLLDLITTWDWTSYFADYGTPKSKYLRVNPSMALSLFEK